MPTTAADIKEFKAPQAIICQIAKRFYGNSGPFYSQNIENLFLNSSANIYTRGFAMTGGFAEFLNTDKQFISLEKTFKDQFEKKKALYKEINFNDAKQKFSESLSYLLGINPDIISIELTPEHSVFYTLKKNEYTIFIQHFLYVLDKEDDEAILTIFKDGIKLPSFGGTLEETVDELEHKLQLESTFNAELSLHELSY